jgi:hypothetical protein
MVEKVGRRYPIKFLWVCDMLDSIVRSISNRKALLRDPGPQLKHNAASSKWQKDDLVTPLFWFTRFRYQLKIERTTTDRHFALMGIDHTPKCNPFPLTSGRFTDQIVVSAKQHSAQLLSPIQKLSIFQFMSAVFVGAQHIDPSASKPSRDRPRHIVIHVQG